jgi:AraC-type transcriptional regulator
MPALEPRLTARAIRPLVSALKTLGHDADAIARATGVDPVLLESPDARVAMCAGVALLNPAVERTGDSNVGLHLAERADPSSFDVHYYAMLASATLGDA